ncbi:MAG: rhodanese-like domain-containing protein [Planctomycetota bacterium]
MHEVHTITPEEAAAALDAKRAGFVLLDIREPVELTWAAVEGATCIPMQDLPDRLAELDGAHEIAVLCHTGRRSHMVTAWLRHQGRTGARNVIGGIDLWSQTVDPAIPRY